MQACHVRLARNVADVFTLHLVALCHRAQRAGGGTLEVVAAGAVFAGGSHLASCRILGLSRCWRAGSRGSRLALCRHWGRLRRCGALAHTAVHADRLVRRRSWRCRLLALAGNRRTANLMPHVSLLFQNLDGRDCREIGDGNSRSRHIGRYDSTCHVCCPPRCLGQEQFARVADLRMIPRPSDKRSVRPGWKAIRTSLLCAVARSVPAAMRLKSSLRGCLWWWWSTFVKPKSQGVRPAGGAASGLLALPCGGCGFGELGCLP